MTRLSYVERADLPAEWRHLFDDLESQRGFIPNLYRAMAHSPRLLERFLQMGAAMRMPGALPDDLKELAILRVAALTGAETMRVSHIAAAHKAGLTDANIRSVATGAVAGLTEAQRSILRFVDEVTGEVEVSDAAWAAAAAFLDEEQLVELTLIAGFYNMVARFLRTAAVDLDQRYNQG